MPKPEILAAIESLSTHATIRGLSEEVLDSLIEILTKTPCRLDQFVAARIVKALIPRRRVAEEVVLKVVGCLGVGTHKPQLGIQVWGPSVL